MSHTPWEKMKPWVMQLSIFATMGVLWWLGISPLLGVLTDKMNEIQKLAVMREHRQKQLEQLPDLENQYALIVADEKKLDIVLTKERLVEFIEALERLAVEGNVRIDIASQDNTFLESKVTVAEKKEAVKKTANAEGDEEGAAPAPKKGASKETGIVTELPLKKYLRLTLTVTGSYGDIVRYLHKLETLPYALDVIALNIKPVLEGGSYSAESGTLNPFGNAVPTPEVPATPVEILDADFETIIYMKD